MPRRSSVARRRGAPGRRDDHDRRGRNRIVLGARRASPSCPPRPPHGTPPRGPFRHHVFASGSALSHATAKGTEPLSKPDDIAYLHREIYVCFANGIGPQGQPSATGTTDSTVVAFTTRGEAVRQWDITGRCDGMAADPLIDRVIVTVNEDANSSLYTVDPHAGTVHYAYSARLPSNGGTDAVSVFHGVILISASAPGTTGKPAPQPGYPAVYRAVLNDRTHKVTLGAVFYDTSRARIANGRSRTSFGRDVTLGLTDPDSNEVVPGYAGRFGGSFMLDSQGDQEQIFTRQVQGDVRLYVLKLKRSVDDTQWPSSARGTLYATDSSADTIDRITGPWRRGSEISSVTPCDQGNAPSVCPAAGFPANYLGEVNSDTGAITALPVRGPKVIPGGLLFVP